MQVEEKYLLIQLAFYWGWKFWIIYTFISADCDYYNFNGIGCLSRYQKLNER